MSTDATQHYLSDINKTSLSRLHLLYGSLPSAAVSHILLALLFCLLLWKDMSSSTASLWLMSIIGLQLYRLWTWQNYRKQAPSTDTDLTGWLSHFRVGAILCGALWGVATWLLVPAEIVSLVFVAFILAGINAAAMTSLAGDHWSLSGFVLLSLTPLALKFISYGGQLAITMAVMIVLFLGFVAVSGVRFRQTLALNEQLVNDALTSQQALNAQYRLSEVIANVQSLFIHHTERQQAFAELLTDLLALTESEYGFIAEVLQTDSGEPYLKTNAITNIAWNDETRALYDAKFSEGMTFYNLNTLFGSVLTTQQVVIANHPADDPRSAGLPHGHPPMRSFLGIPVQYDDQLIAMIGLANRPGGYDEAQVNFLHPLTVTLGQLIHALQIQRDHRAAQQELTKLSQVASQTTNGVIITNLHGEIEWINEGMTRISGYSAQEMIGKRPADLLQGPDTDPLAIAEMDEGFRKQQAFQVEIVNYTKQGEPYWIRIQASPIRDDAGKIIKFMAIETDISNERASQDELRHYLKGLAVLNQISSAPVFEVDKRLNEALRLAADYLDMEVASIGEVHQNTYSNKWLVAPETAALQAGHSLPLNQTFCQLALQQADVVAIDNVSASDYRHHPAFVVNGVKRYIGIALKVSNQLYGTMSFVSFDEGLTAFKDSEQEFVRLLSRWVVSTLERDQDNQRLQKLTAHIPGMVYQFQQWPDGRFSFPYSSPGIKQIYGVNAGEVYENAAAAFAVIHPDDMALMTASITHSRETLSNWQLQYRVRQDEQPIHWLEGEATPELMGDGSVLWHGYIKDITAQKSAELAIAESEARLRGLFELSPVGIALNDFDTGKFIDVNPALQAFTGYSREEFLSLSFLDMTPDEYIDKEKQQIESLQQTGQYGPYEKEYINKSGKRIPVLLYGMTVQDGKDHQLIWSIVEDISERKRLENLKNDFIATVSHELRTPLTAIGGAIDLLLSNATGELPDAAREMLLISQKNSQRLRFLINDLLDIEKLTSGNMRFHLKPVRLKEQLQQAIDTMRLFAVQYSVTLELMAVSESIWIAIDIHRFQQIMANLLSNAAKFSPEGYQVVIAVTATEDLVRITVSDEGAGILPEHQQQVFDKFYQIDSAASRHRGGSGLGLAITRQLVEHMKGKIGLDTTPGEGTSFWIELPRYQQQNDAADE